MTHLRWTAVTADGTVDLPDVLTSTLGLTWGEATGGEITYSLHGQRADLLDARLHEVPLLRAHMAVGPNWVPVGGDLVARQVQADREAEAPTVQVSLVDAVADTLGTVTLWPKDGATVDADGNRLFTAATAGSIVQTWLAEAQARGEAQHVKCWATPTRDSAGRPWNREATLAFGHEDQSLAAIIEALWASGMCDWHTEPGGVLVLRNPESSQSDRSGTVALHAGADVGHAPQTQGTGDTAHTIRVIGDEGKHVVIEDPELPVGPTGKRSAIVSGAGATDEGTLRTIGEAWIKQNNRAADHLTRELVWQGKFLPLADYYLGDHITAPGVTGAMEKCRVSEITLTTEGNELTPDSAISLNGKYSDPLLRLTKRQNGLIGVSKTGGGNNTRPRPDGPDKRTPATPTGLGITSEAYTVRKSQTAAVARAVWAPVTTDERGVAMEVRAYEVRWRRESANDRPWRTASVTDTDHTQDNLAAGGRYEWQVRAVGPLAKSPWSASKWHTNAEDATPPPKPSTPTLTATRRIVTVGWDGYTAEGGRMPLDTGKVQAAVYSASTLPAQITADMVYRGGVMWDPSGDWESPLSLTIADAQLGDVFARIRAVDDTGNASEWSDEATIHVEPTVDVGEIDDAITDAIDDARDRIDQINDEVIPGLRGDMDAADQAAQDAAARAASDAAAAQQTAEQAVTDAAAAAGRSTTVWQATAPTDKGVLWIKTPDNTPHVWDGSAWVPVTDQAVVDAADAASEARAAAQAAQDAADAAQQRAEEAVGLANAAQSAAEAAQATADGAQSDADQALQDAAQAAGAAKAIRSPEPPADKTVLWIDSDNGDRPHLWNGSVWALVTDQRLTDAADAAGDAQQTADAAQAAADAAAEGVDEVRALANAAQQAAEGAAQDAANAAGKSAVVWQSTAPSDTTVLWIKTPGDTPYVHDGTSWVVVTDQRILDAAEAADDARNAAQAAQEAADAAQEAADNAQGTADEALARAITADGRVTVSSRVPVTADGAGKPVGALWQTYSGDALVAFYRWDGSAWKAMPLSRSIIPLLDIGQGTFGTLDGARLKAGSIATNRLAVTDWTNHVENPAPELRPEGVDDGWGGAVSPDAAGSPRIRRGGVPSGYATTLNARKFVVTPGDSTPYRVTAVLSGGLYPAQARAGIYWQKADNSTAGYSYTPTVTTTGSAPQTIDGTITPPADAATGTVLVQVIGGAASPPAFFRNVTARRVTPSVLIEDGAITAAKITASEELTAKIASFLKLKAGQIDVNSLAADEVFAGLMQAQVLRLGAVHPEHLSFGTDEIIPDPLWFDAARRSRRSQGSGGWTFLPATSHPWAATGGQTHVLRAYNGSLQNNDSVALTDITAAAPGEIFSLEMTAGCTTANPTGTIYFQAAFRRPDGSFLFSTSNAVAAGSFKTANRLQTFRKIVTVPDGVDGVMFRIVAGSVTNASTGTWAVSRVSARKGNVSRDQSGAGSVFSPQGIHIWNELGEDTFKVGIDENSIIACDTFRTGTPSSSQPQIMLSNTISDLGLPGLHLSSNGSFGNERASVYLRPSPRGGNELNLRSEMDETGVRRRIYLEGSTAVAVDGASTPGVLMHPYGALDFPTTTRSFIRTPTELAFSIGYDTDSRRGGLILDRHATGARIKMDNLTDVWTTTSAANVHVSPSGGYLYRSTSVRAAKVNIQPHQPAGDILDVEPVTWFDRGEAERRAEWEAGTSEETEEPPIPRQIVGAVAEQVEEAGLGEYLTRHDDGTPAGLAYERMWLALIPVVREQRDQIAQQQAQIDALTARLDALEARND